MKTRFDMKKLRENLGMTQDVFARKLQISNSLLSYYETNETVSAEAIFRLRDLGIDPTPYRIQEGENG